MKLEVGKRYVCSDPEVQYVEIESRSLSDEYPYQAMAHFTDGSVDYPSYTHDGRCFTNRSSPWDLIAEYQEHLDNLSITQRTIPDAAYVRPEVRPWIADGEILKMQGTALKADTGKPRMELLSPVALEEIAKVMTYGAQKYTTPNSSGDHNWRKGFAWSRLFGAMLRHTFAALRGEDRDPESGHLHLAHAGCCVMMLLEHVVENLGTDDRYKRQG